MKKNLLLLLLLESLFCFAANTKALVVLDEDNKTCTETIEHKKWSKLSVQEKKETIEPIKCQEIMSASTNKVLYDELGSSPANSETIPRFSLKDTDALSDIKDQGASNLCWAFATMDAIETNYRLNNDVDINLSRKHMDFNISNSLSDGSINPIGYPNKIINSGASPLMISAYLAMHRGPVLESIVPWETTSSTLENAVYLKNNYIVNDINYYISNSCQENDNQAIKNIKSIIFRTGPAIGMGYINYNLFGIDGKSYYYNGDELNNHSFLIVGWDDEYSASNFKTTPDGDGAFIIKDQQGADFADNGYYYISYYDKKVCNVTLQVDDVIEKVYDNEYRIENYGQNGFITYPTNTFYFKNKYTKQTDKIELLKSVTVGTNMQDDEYKVYYSETGSLTDAELIGEGIVDSYGYDTIILDNPISITTDHFYLLMEYTTNDYNGDSYNFPVSLIDSNSSSYYYLNNPTSGISFYSVDQVTWNDSITTNSNVMFYPVIYASTDSRDYNILIDDATTDDESVNVIDGGSYDFPFTLNRISSIDDVDIIIENENNTDVTDEFDIIKSTSSINVAVKVGTTTHGNYKMILSYQDISVFKGFYVSKTTGVDVREITIDGPSEVAVDGTLDLSVVIKPTDASNKEVDWSVNNENAIIDNGILTGIKAGTVAVSATSKDGTNVVGTKVVSVIDTNSLGEEIDNPKTSMIATIIVVSFAIISFGAVYYCRNKGYFINNK